MAIAESSPEYLNALARAAISNPDLRGELVVASIDHARTIVSSRARDPEDLAQSIGLKLWAGAIDHYAPREGVEYITWLKTVTLRTLYDQSRRKKRRPQTSALDETGFYRAPTVADRYSSESSVRGVLERANLTDKQREVIEDRFIRGLSLLECASEQRLTVEAVKKLQARALSNLRKVNDVQDLISPYESQFHLPKPIWHENYPSLSGHDENGPVRVYRIRPDGLPYVYGPNSVGSKRLGFRRHNVGRVLLGLTSEGAQVYPTLKQAAETVYADKAPSLEEASRRNDFLAKMVVRMRGRITDELLKLIFEGTKSVTKPTIEDINLRLRVTAHPILSTFDRDQMKAFLWRDFDLLDLREDQDGIVDRVEKWRDQSKEARKKEKSESRVFKENRDITTYEQEILLASTQLNPDGTRVYPNAVAVAELLLKEGEDLAFKTNSVRKAISWLAKTLRREVTPDKQRVIETMKIIKERQEFGYVGADVITSVMQNKYDIVNGKLVIDPKGFYKRRPRISKYKEINDKLKSKAKNR